MALGFAAESERHQASSARPSSTLSSSFVPAPGLSAARKAAAAAVPASSRRYTKRSLNLWIGRQLAPPMPPTSTNTVHRQ
jgi:hypothetical protein